MNDYKITEWDATRKHNMKCLTTIPISFLKYPSSIFEHFECIICKDFAINFKVTACCNNTVCDSCCTQMDDKVCPYKCSNLVAGSKVECKWRDHIDYYYDSTILRAYPNLNMFDVRFHDGDIRIAVPLDDLRFASKRFIEPSLKVRKMHDAVEINKKKLKKLLQKAIIYESFNGIEIYSSVSLSIFSIVFSSGIISVEMIKKYCNVNRQNYMKEIMHYHNMKRIYDACTKNKGNKKIS